MNNVTYSDRLVEMTVTSITFNCYYFPFGKKQLLLSQIQEICIYKFKGPSNIWRQWGTGDFLHWFPLDWNRPKRDTLFVIKQKGKRIRIGFTVENAKQFEECLKESAISDSIVQSEQHDN